jgi:hypothetical protein
MQTELAIGIVAVIVALAVTLVITYVWSSSPDRRTRAKEMMVMLTTLLPLLPRRGPQGSPIDDRPGHEGVDLGSPSPPAG